MSSMWLLTKGVDEQQVDGGMQSEHNGTCHNLWPHNLLRLKVVGGGDVGCKAPHAWQGPPANTGSAGG